MAADPYDALRRVRDAIHPALLAALGDEAGDLAAVVLVTRVSGGATILGGAGLSREATLEVLLEAAVAHAEQVLGYQVKVTRPDEQEG